MKLILDLQGYQTLSRYRGIGHYTASLTKAMIEQGRNRGHDISIILNSIYPETIEDICKAFDGILDRKNILVWKCPKIDNASYWTMNAAELIRERFLDNLEPDIVHISTFFETYAVTSIGKYYRNITTAVTLYDLVPFMNAEVYLSDPYVRKLYMDRLKNLSRADLLLAISESARQEALSTSFLKNNKIVTISSDVDASFQVLKLSISEEDRLKRKYGIKNDYIMCTAPLSGDYRKNVENLIRAYALLDSNMRKSHQLLLVGNCFEGVLERMKKFMKNLGLAEKEVIFTDYVNQVDLIVLYNLCKLFVFPSLHEGFGLPVLEAMRCGVPVIASDRSSMPEIVVLKEALFNPELPEAIAARISMALQDSAYYERLRKNSNIQQKRYSWEKSAKSTLDAFEILYDQKGLRKQIQVLQNKGSDFKRLTIAIQEIQAAPENLRELKAVTEAIAENESNVKELKYFDIVINGHISGSYSLASYNRGLAAALYENKAHNVFIQPYECEATDWIGNVPEKERIWLEKRLKSRNYVSSACVNIFGHYPLLIPKNEEDINIALFFWEESLVPEDMIDTLNFYYDGVLVATNFIKKVLIDSGLEKPIKVIGAGMGLSGLGKAKVSRNGWFKNRPFTFLHVSSCFPRKGVDALLAAYGKEFDAKDNVKLIVKGFPNIHNDIELQIQSLLKANKDLSKIEFINKDIAEDELLSIYGDVDAIVLPTRGEGLNFPAAEAMYLGQPLLTTNYSGHVDFCNCENAWMVDYHFDVSGSHLGKSGSVWVNPDIDDLARQMRTIVNQRRAKKSEEKLNRQLELTKQNIRERFNWSNVAERTIEFCNKIRLFELNKKQIKLGWVSPWNSKCGIAEYSAFLLNEFEQENTDIVVYSCSDNKQFDNQAFSIVDCFSDGKFEFPLEQIISDNIEILVLQYNFGLYDFTNLIDYIESLVKADVKVVIVFHGTEALSRFDRDIIDMLRLCNRILVHTLYDMNRLKSYGLVNNVTYFPQGVLNELEVESNSKLINDCRLTIGSYGFFFAHKGLHELITAFHGILNIIHNSKLILINAEYPLSISSEEIERCKKYAKQLGIYKFIEWHTDFKSNAESLTTMRECDMLVFAYQNTVESSSAAVRLGLASGKPVITTPIPIFDEVKDITYQTRGIEVQDIKDGILELWKDKDQQNDLVNKQREWVINHDWKKIAKRMQGMLRGLVNLRVK